MFRNKKVLLATLILALALSLGACGTLYPPAEEPAAPEAAPAAEEPAAELNADGFTAKQQEAIDNAIEAALEGEEVNADGFTAEQQTAIDDAIADALEAQAEEAAPESRPEESESWHRITVSKYFETFGVEKWELPLGTFYATDTSKGRYTAVQSAPTGPQANSSDAGWCGVGQYGCPPHLMLYKTEVTNGTSAIMDIPTRVLVKASKDGGLHLQLRFNDETRTPSELMDDYDAAASMGELGLFIASRDSSMQPAILEYLDDVFEVGYACWDCLAHTAGQNDDIVPLDDISHFGQSTPSQGDSFFPGYVIPIPSPDEDPDFEINLAVFFPKGTEVVVWLGRYDAE